MDVPSHKLPQAHEGVRCRAKGVGVIAREREGTPVVHHECLSLPFLGPVRVCHDFVAW